MAESDDVKYREWAIALGVTTAVFFVTTIVLAVILFFVICRKIAKIRKERDARVTGTLQGVTSPHWIDHTNLHDMLERDEHDKPPENIWSISTQTFHRNQNQSQQQMTSSLPAATTAGSAEEEMHRETDDGERTTSMSGSFSPARQSAKPKRQAPLPPKTRTKSKSKGCNGMTTNEKTDDPMPYVYPIHKLQLRQSPKVTGGNQSHEYAQPHSLKHDDNGKVSSSKGKHVYHALDPTCKQPAGQYQELLLNGLPRGQSLPAISIFTTQNS